MSDDFLKGDLKPDANLRDANELREITRKRNYPRIEALLTVVLARCEYFARRGESQVVICIRCKSNHLTFVSLVSELERLGFAITLDANRTAITYTLGGATTVHPGNRQAFEIRWD